LAWEEWEGKGVPTTEAGRGGGWTGVGVGSKGDGIEWIGGVGSTGVMELE